MEAPTESDSDDPPAALLATLHELRCARQRSVDDVAFDSVEEWNLVSEGGDWRTVCALCPPKRSKSEELEGRRAASQQDVLGRSQAHESRRERRDTHTCTE